MKLARQTGISLISTLFLLVVVSLVAGYLVQLSTVQHTASALSVSTASARYALSSGFEWVLYEINRTGGCPAAPATVTVDTFQVRVLSCSALPVTEGERNYQMFDVSLNAQRGSFGTADYTSASLRASLSN